MSNPLTPELELQIVEMYLSGKGFDIIRKTLGVTHYRISQSLKKNNIHIKSNYKRTSKELELKVINEYLGGNSTYVVGEINNLSHATVYNILIRNNIPMRDSAYILSINQSKDKYDSLNLNVTCNYAYFMGALEGDGCVSRTEITLTAKDKEFVLKFKEILEEFGFSKIYFKKEELSKKNKHWCDVYRVRTHSKIFVDKYKELQTKGKVFEYYKKHFTTKSMKANFIAGSFDSEGSVYVKYNEENIPTYIRLSFTNTNEDYVKYYCECLTDLNITHTCIQRKDRRGHKTLWEVGVGTKEGVLKFYNEICPHMAIIRHKHKIETSLIKRKQL
jgi:hypothetical protein